MKKSVMTTSFALIFLSVLFITYVRSNNSFENVTPPTITGNSPKDILIKLINSEGAFIGSGQVKYIDSEMNTIEIIVLNNDTEDDSVQATEQKYIVKKQNNEWKITKLLQRWKCRSMLEFGRWTTKA